MCHARTGPSARTRRPPGMGRSRARVCLPLCNTLGPTGAARPRKGPPRPSTRARTLPPDLHPPLCPPRRHARALAAWPRVRPTAPTNSVDQMRQLPTARSGALDEHQVEAGGHLDGPSAAAFLPSRRAVGHGPILTGWLEHAVGEQLVPTEEGMVPSHVVGMHHRRGRHCAMEPLRERGLSRPAPSIDGHHGGPPERRSGRAPDAGDDLLQGNGQPETRSRLLRAQRHHVLVGHSRTFLRRVSCPQMCTSCTTPSPRRTPGWVDRGI
jgi:hypothetical protein